MPPKGNTQELEKLIKTLNETIMSLNMEIKNLRIENESLRKSNNSPIEKQNNINIDTEMPLDEKNLNNEPRAKRKKTEPTDWHTLVQQTTSSTQDHQTIAPGTTHGLSSKPPPIKIFNKDSIYIIRLLKESIKTKNFLIKKNNNFQSSLLLENITEYKKTVEELKNKKINFYTYTPRHEKPQTFLLKGLSADSDLEEVKKELSELKNVKFQKIERFSTPRSIRNGITLPPY